MAVVYLVYIVAGVWLTNWIIAGVSAVLSMVYHTEAIRWAAERSARNAEDIASEFMIILMFYFGSEHAGTIINIVIDKFKK